MSMLLPLTPGQTIKVTTSGSSAQITLPGTGRTVEIVNSAAFSCAIALGSNPTAAVATGSFAASSYHIPAVVGARRVITRDPDNQTKLAYISDSGAAVLYITVGDGE